MGVMLGGAAGVALVGYALASVVAAPPVLDGSGLDSLSSSYGAPAGHGYLGVGTSGLWWLAVRIASVVSMGQPAARIHLISLAAGAAAVSLLLGRSLAGRRHDGERERTRVPDRAPARAHAVALSLSRASTPGVPATLVTPAGPQALAGPTALAAPVEMIAALFGAITVALSRSFFLAATGIGSSAVGVLQALASLALAERVARAPGDRRAGFGMALLAGLSVGGPLVSAAVAWPVAALVLARAHRKGQRWPVRASLLFAVGLAIGLALDQSLDQALDQNSRAVISVHLSALGQRAILLPVIRAVAHLSLRGLAQAATELIDQIGILAAMIAVAGLPSLGRTSLIFTLWSFVAGLALCAAFAGVGSGVEATLGMIVAVTSLALPLGAGIARLAERLGRARLPAAAAMGIIVATWPFLAR